MKFTAIFGTLVAHGLAGSLRLQQVQLAAEHTNPLLEKTDAPRFADVRPEHMKPGVLAGLESGKTALADIESTLKQPSPKDAAAAYERLLLPLQELYEHVSHPWEILGHLKSVADSKDLRDVTEEMQPKIVSFYQGVSQSKPIYKALTEIKESSSYASLPEPRRRTVEKELLDRKLGGVGLTGAQAGEFNKLEQELSGLQTDFSNHVLDATKAWNLTVTDKARVDGVPERALAAAASNAVAAGHKDASATKGPWLFTLDGTVLWPTITYANDQSLRETLFRASATKASSGSSDNSKTMLEILKRRQRKAELLDFPNFAELSMASKMATRNQVHDLLDKLQLKAKPAAIKDESELRAFAEEKFGAKDLKHWDRGFYATKLQKQRFDIDAESLRVYFPMPSVTTGLFSLAKRLFDVDVKLDESRPETLWHADVRLYQVYVNGTHRGSLFTDPYSRPGQKRAGAWVQPMITRKHLGSETQLPLCVIVCNFPAPQAGKPALLSLGEVGTYFHEFGHALQHLLTVQDESSVSGLNGVEWDAVEIASQFMEYWVDYDKATLYSFAKHYETGKPLPEDMHERMQESTNFRVGTGLVSQVYLGSIDLRLHEEYQQGEDVNAIGFKLAGEILATPPLPEARQLCSFSHIFSGGYSAGYYSYQWSKVLSADLFSAFDEAGLTDATRTKALGRRLAATLMGLGGGRAPAKVFEDFRGRAPLPQALLRYSGLDA